MKSLPIMPNETLDIEYPAEKAGEISATFSLGYLVDNRQPKFIKMISNTIKSKNAFLPQAKKLIAAKKGKRWKKGEKDKAIDQKCNDLYFAEVSLNPESHHEDMAEYIDLFCVKTYSKAKNFKCFPENYDPSIKLSSSLMIEDKTWLYTQIMMNIDELTSASAETKKKP